MMGTVYRAGKGGFSPHIQGSGEEVCRSCRPYSMAHIVCYLSCPRSMQVLLFLHQNNCPLVRSLALKARSPRCRSHTSMSFCFSLPGVSSAPFTVCYFPKASDDWRNRDVGECYGKTFKPALKVRLTDFRGLGAVSTLVCARESIRPGE